MGDAADVKPLQLRVWEGLEGIVGSSTGVNGASKALGRWNKDFGLRYQVSCERSE